MFEFIFLHFNNLLPLHITSYWFIELFKKSSLLFCLISIDDIINKCFTEITVFLVNLVIISAKNIVCSVFMLS